MGNSVKTDKEIQLNLGLVVLLSKVGLLLLEARHSGFCGFEGVVTM